jgi:hypothetical protein
MELPQRDWYFPVGKEYSTCLGRVRVALYLPVKWPGVLDSDGEWRMESLARG